MCNFLVGFLKKLLDFVKRRVDIKKRGPFEKKIQIFAVDFTPVRITNQTVR